MKIVNFIILISLYISMSSAATPYSQPQKDKIKKMFMDEKKVKDVMWESDKKLYVAVVPDGTKRDGYAQYLCLLARDVAKPLVSYEIEIKDIIQIVKYKKFTTIGEATCKP